jgi:hypothetical protein
MRKYLGWIVLATGSAAVGAWACGRQVTACDDPKTCPGEPGSMDGSADSPLVQATLPDAGGAADGDKKEGKESGASDGPTTEDSTTDARELDDSMLDSPATDSPVMDSAGPMCHPPGGSSDAPMCTPGAAPAANGCVADGSGVFVATAAKGGSDTTGQGSTAKPYATISYALAHLGTSGAVYVCGGHYVDQVTVSAPVSIYGGLTCMCGTWVYDASALAVVTGSSSSFALKIAVPTGAVDVEDFEVEGATAAAGESSVAVWVNASSSVVLHRTKIVGGAGGLGASPGAPTANYTGATAPAGAPSSASETSEGAAGGSISCADGVTSSQGGHGYGTNVIAVAGTLSYTTPYPATNTGAPGIQQGISGEPGTPGSDGELGGAAGIALTTTGKWSMSKSAWIPSVAETGGHGGAGQGGGGGTMEVSFPADGGPPVSCFGGGGGAGGCGGSGGLGATSGGASFGLLSVNSTVVLDGCNVTAGPGGGGGTGGNGEAGQGPGAGGAGPSSLPGCTAGRGGYGQGGGGGGGGSAGPSVALAYVGTLPTYGADSQIVASGAGATPGTGGMAGAGDSDVLTTDPNAAANGPAGDATVPVARLSLPTTT